MLVETLQGKLEGVQEDSLQAFRGVPFARPPTGALRFHAPEPPEPWVGVREASRFGRAAPQTKAGFDLFSGFDVGEQGEDCLYLNVYTPAADGARRPVMLWIHGGAYIMGSGSQAVYRFGALVRRGDVVVVSINYRLGALGFLHLADLGGASRNVTGNAGLLDQVAALQWVHDNIGAFGGDPGKVTIFGESAGGMSVGTLLGTPAAQALFHRAVPQSGAAHSVLGRRGATKLASSMLEELGILPRQLDRLWSTPVEAILEAQQACYTRAVGRGQRSFQPVIDGDVLPEPPLDAIRKGLARDVPVLVGATRDEWRLFGLMDPQSAKLDMAALVARIETRIPGADDSGTTRGHKIVEGYRRARGRARDDPPELFFAIETDRMFRSPAVRLAEAQSSNQRHTYAYLFTWPSVLMGGALRACHGVDVPFVFGAIGSKGADRFVGGGSEAEALQQRTMDAWLAFARNGDPNHHGLPTRAPYATERRATMFLGPKCELVDAPFEEERRIWEGIL